MTDRLKAAACFVRAADLGSFTRAAESLEMPLSNFSRAVAALERTLGGPLFVRTTRAIALTSRGEALLPAARRLIASADALFADPAPASGRLAGRLRIGCGVAIGLGILPALLQRFSAMHPAVHFQVTMADRPFELIRDRLDLALQAIEPIDENAVVGAILPIKSIMAASPEYLERRGTPEAPEALAQHDALANDLFGCGWTMRRESAPDDAPLVKIEVRPAFAANNTMLLREMALLGRGIAFFASRMIEDDLREGRLVRVLPDWRGETTHLRLLMPSRSYASAAARAFAEFIRAEAEAGGVPLPASY